MKLGNRSSKALFAAVAVLLALAAIAVPAATAKPSGRGVYGSLDPWAYAAIHARDNSGTARGVYGSLDPWAYAAIHAPKSQVRAAASAVDAPGSGFAWGAFAIGVAATVGGLLLLGALARLVDGGKLRLALRKPQATA